MSTSKQVLITGASGLLGRSLVQNFKKSARHTVLTAGRKPEDTIQFDLRNPAALHISCKLNVVIHCSYDFNNFDLLSNLDINLNATLELYRLSKNAGSSVFIYISSMSAHSNCKSIYGKTKLAIEKDLQKHPDVIIIRPGLLYDSAMRDGTLAKMVQLATTKLLLPLIDGGKQPQYTTNLDDLFRFLLEAIESPAPYLRAKPIFIGDSIKRTLKELIEVATSKKIKSIYLPWWLAWCGLKFLEILRVRTTFRSDSVFGLKDAAYIDEDEMMIISKFTNKPFMSMTQD